MSEHSELFTADVGTWDGEITVRAHPGAEPQLSKGVMTFRLIGGWLVSDFKNETGFEGRGIYGWDRAKQVYVATWIDDARGSLVVGTGTRDGTTMTYRYELALPDRTMRWHDVQEVVDANTRRFRSFYELPSGEAHEVVTALYRRR
jgi:hypothetical protein